MTAETSSEGSLESLAADLAASPYEPVRFLARGGMGEVVVVEHRELGRKLVMKLLRTNLAGQEHLAERMRAEARMLARLSHPSLVSVVDSGRTAGGRPFLVTELLEGDTLSDYVKARGGELPVREALDLGAQTLAGLAVVHEAGFVHRDLKPANLFIVKAAGTARGADVRRLKILDFGIAKALSESDRKALGLIAPTTEGAIMGTPSSVSPEQVQSGKVDARTDVYGLGVVLFRLISGRPPFLGDALQLFRAHLLEPAPRPSSIAKQPVPRVVDEIILKALEKEPAKRYQSAGEMRVAIERAILDISLEAEPTEESEGEGNARTVEAPYARMQSPAMPFASVRVGSQTGPRDSSDDETTTQPAPGAGAGAVAGGTAVIAVGGGTAVMDMSLVNAPTVAATPSPSAGANRSASVRVPAPATLVSEQGVAGGAVAGGVAGVPRKTELLARVAQNAPRDTVKLEEAGGAAGDPPWKYDPAVAQPRLERMVQLERMGRREVAVPKRSAVAAWAPIALAVVASVVVLLCLFVWKVL